MELKIYNSLTRKKEALQPIDNTVNYYFCGPTVYWFQHIGNMRAFFVMDTVRRAVKYLGYNINQVMNITDVGHMTSDADEGEDKMEVASKRENKTPEEIAKYYWDICFEDMKNLNIEINNRIYSMLYIWFYGSEKEIQMLIKHIEFCSLYGRGTWDKARKIEI